MKKYTTLLFDADMTLFDFEQAEHDAFGIVMTRLGIQLSDGDFELYSNINAELWKQFGRGEITKDYLQDNRFRLFFEALGNAPRLNARTVNLEFLDSLAECSRIFDGAEEMCRLLSRGYDMFIVTNGISRVQKKRFYNSALLQYFGDIFVSEDAGAPKPSAKYFDFVFSKIGNNRRDSAVIIGDSLTSDIAGGINAGIDTVWFNPKNEPGECGIIPTAEVHSYSELSELLLMQL